MFNSCSYILCRENRALLMVIMIVYYEAEIIINQIGNRPIKIPIRKCGR